MLDIEAKELDEESGPDLGLIIPHMEFYSKRHYTALGENGDSTTESGTMTQDTYRIF